MPYKRLTLVRHAKAEPGFSDSQDWERALARRGQTDAEEMGRRLRSRKLKPTLIVASPALRTLTTARIVAGELRYPLDLIREDERLYQASDSVFLKVVREASAETHLMIVGHNPGISEFADRLAADRRIDMVPTCGVVTAEFDIADWKDFQLETAVALEFDYPGAV